jgi:hypothetical protein
MNKLKLFWDSIRSNPVWVAFEGGASGAVLDYGYDLLNSGHLDFTAQGFRKLALVAITGGVTSVRLLYRPQPNPTIPATLPPSTQVEDMPATLKPTNPAAVPVEPK